MKHSDGRQAKRFKVANPSLVSPSDAPGGAIDQESLAFLLDQAPTFIAILEGSAGVVRLYNQAFRHLWGERDVIGMPMRKAWPELEGQGYFEVIEKVYKTGKSVYGDEYPGRIDRKGDGNLEEAYFNFIFKPHTDKDGRVLGVALYGIEVTDHVLTRRRIEKNEQHLASAMQASHMGTWEWNVETGDVMWSKEQKEIFGLSPKESDITFDRVISMIHPEDRERIRTAAQNALDGDGNYKSEFRIVWPDGSIHWMVGYGRVFRWDSEATRLVGTTMNADAIMRQRQLEKRTASLESQRTELMKLNQAKDEFISIASHQLRTPASSVKQYVGMLLQGYAGPLSETQTKMLKVAYESNDRQIQIVNNLLKVAQVDAGKIKLTKDMHDINELLVELVEEFSGKFKHREQKLVYRHLRKPLTANIDVRLMRMALENIIDNASKYSYKDGTVTVGLRRLTHHAVMQVCDTGVGVSKKDQKKLFQKFARVTNPLSTEADGTGLGLYWAKQIVELHGGTIQVESTLRKGTTFIIRVPF